MRTVRGLLAAVVSVGLLTLTAPAAQAAPSPCRELGQVAGYVTEGEGVDWDRLSTTPNRYREQACRYRGMRVTKTHANTRREVRELRRLTRKWGRVSYAAWCPKQGSRAVSIWLSYNGWDNGQANAAERDHFKTWAQARGCRVHGVRA